MSMDSPLISVVIPCYNGEEFLEECVRSVLAQEANCEIIVVDDGSTDASVDRSRKLINEIAGDMIVISQKNRGPAVARNTGMRIARGKYICFLDVDDQYAPGFFAHAPMILEKHAAAVAVFCEVELVNAHREVEIWQREAIERSLPSNILMRTEVMQRIGGFPEHQAFRGTAAGEDGALRAQLLRQGKVLKIHKPFFKYRVRAGSHFDYFLDRAVFKNGKMSFSKLSEEEQNGSLIVAIKEYHRSVIDRKMDEVAQKVRSGTETNFNFCRLAQRFESVEGHLHPVEGYALYNLARSWPIAGATVEIGGSKGLSTCWLAAGCKEGRYGKVVAVAPFRSASAPANDASSDPGPQNGSAPPGIRRRLEQQKLADQVTLSDEFSAESAENWSDPIRLLFFGGDHSYESVIQRFSAWSPYIREGGLALFHNIDAVPEITRFYTELCASDGPWKELMRCRTLGILQKRRLPDATENAPLVASNGQLHGPQGKRKAAEEEHRLREVLQKDPQNADALAQLARLLEAQKNWDEAIVVSRQLIQLQPNHVDGHNCLGISLARRQEFAEAIEHFQTVIRLQPDRAGAYHNMAVACTDQGLPEEAIRYFNETLRLAPDHAEAHKGKGMALLTLGQFREAWGEYEWRWKCKDLTPLRTDRPLWDGSSLVGKTILLHSEQGIGDTLQFVRYASRVKAEGGTVLLACAPTLFRLFQTCPGIDQLVTRRQPLPPHDFHAPLLSLPRIFRTELANIPQDIPYLFADPARVDAWRREWADVPEFKVGIVWQGNPKHAKDACRSIPLSQFQTLAEVAGVRLFGLQFGKGNEQLDQIAGRFAVTDLRARLDGGFVEIPAAMKSLDLMICCDSAMAHLAGALGVPVWVALPFAPDWRWLLDREGSPWYPTMRLFRQEKMGDWQNVFARMAEALSHEAQKRKADHAAENTYRRTEQIAEPLSIPPADMIHPPVNEGPLAPPESLRLQRLLTLARKHHQAKEFKQCEQVAQQIVGEHPRNVTAWFILALARQAQGKLETAADAFRRLTEEKPDHVEGHFNLGITLCRLGRRQEGENFLREAIRLEPNHAKAHNNLGIVLAETGKRAEALTCWQEAVRLDPNYAEGHFNAAIGAAENGRAEEAQAHYEKAIALRPDYPEAYCNLGMLHIEQGRPGEAIVLLEHAIRIREDFVDAYNNLGMALADLGRLEEALNCYREALRRRPKYAEVHNNVGTALAAMGRPHEALACFAHALRLRPEYPEARWHQALTWLQQGDMERGWPQYEWRWKRKRARPRHLPQPLWDGANLEGKTILLWSEQGLGDNLQFIRYAPLVKALGSTVLVECPEKLLGIFSGCAGIDQLIPERTQLPSFDVQVPLLSLPALFNTRVHSIPAEVPYLFADPAKVEKWREELHLDTSKKLRIGIIWQGNPKHRWDRHRSFGLHQFHPLARMDGVQLYSLQKGAPPEDLAHFVRRYGLVDLSPRLDDFTDTAAAMRNLDLVITCDSAPAHLAGALGVPVWVPLATMCDWRWLTKRDDSPWYPTMRLFRQKRLGDWDEVFGRVEREAKELLARRNTPLTENSD